LLALLEGIGEGIGFDSSIIQSKKYKDYYIVSTTDFFYPLVEDPLLQGKIAAANVLSDMYALGVTDIDNCLMILASSLDMPQQSREIVTKLMIRGFDEHTKHAETVVSGGQSILNPWPIIGGTAKSICLQRDILYPVYAKIGDVLVLTKPLGTQCAVNGKQWLNTPDKWAKYGPKLRREWVLYAYHAAVKQMLRLNKNAAKLMHKWDSHAATDITGFGLLGHAENLASNQLENVDFVVDTLPIIKYMTHLNQQCWNFKLLTGYSAETSGGLFIAMSRANAESYIKELAELDGEPAWIIGEVVEGNKKARILENPKIIEI
jgi:selenide,water dikinase